MQYEACYLDRVITVTALHTAFTQKYDTSFHFDGEAHDFWEMVCVLEGQIGVTADTEVYFLKKGQAIFHRPMVFHKIWAEMKTNPQIVIFSFSADPMPYIPSVVYQLTSKNMDELRDMVALAYQTLRLEGIHVRGAKPGRTIDVQKLLNRLELFILSVLANEQEKNSLSLSPSAQNYSRIVKILEENIDKNLSVTEIAQMAEMGASNVKKIFQKYAGMGVMQYFTSKKMTRAKELLGSGMSVKETALSVGFADQNYFSTVFKKQTGMPPRTYAGRGVE